MQIRAFIWHRSFTNAFSLLTVKTKIPLHHGSTMRIFPGEAQWTHDRSKT